MRNLKNGSGHVEDKRKKKSGRKEDGLVLSARTCSYDNLSSASEVVDVALALAPLPRVESKGALDERGEFIGAGWEKCELRKMVVSATKKDGSIESAGEVGRERSDDEAACMNNRPHGGDVLKGSIAHSPRNYRYVE